MSASPNARSTSARDGALSLPAARNICAWRDEVGVVAAGCVAVAVDGALGAAVAQAASNSRAALEARNRIRAKMPLAAPARNACHAKASALKRLNLYKD